MMKFAKYLRSNDKMLSVLFYLTLYFIVFTIQIFAMKQKNEKARTFFALASFALILAMIGLRSSVGTDYDSYASSFYNFTKLSFTEAWHTAGDVGTKLIFWISSHIFTSARSVFWIYGMLSLYPIYKINKKSRFQYLAYTTLIYNFLILPASLNIIR